MTTTGIAVASTNYPDYSRYSSLAAEREVVVRWLPLTPDVGDTFLVTLSRLDGWGAVATRAYTWRGDEPAGVASCTFALATDCRDAQGFYRAVQGDYVATVALGAWTATTAPFTISLVGVRELRDSWLFGMTRLAGDVKRVRQQPRLLPGVVVDEVSTDHFNGAFPLAYTVAPLAPPVQVPQAGLLPGLATPYTLAWNGGLPVAVVPGLVASYLLVDAKGEDWLRVTVDPMLLPNVTTTETLVVDQGFFADEQLVRHVRRATAWLEGVLANSLPLEPRTVATEAVPPAGVAAPPLVEEVVAPAMYERPGNTAGQWLYVKFGKRGPLALDYLGGFMNRTQVVTVPTKDWVVLSHKAGRCDLVPSTGSVINYMLYGQPFFAFLNAYSQVPNFWHYGGTFGLPDLDDARAVVREAIARQAAIGVALELGAAYKAGISSESVSRDGVSTSTSYTSSAGMGPFTHVTKPWQDWLDAELPKLRTRLLGLQLVTLQ